MKSYYHSHESAYQQIKSKGYIGWGNAKNLSELGDAKTNEYLNQKIHKHFSITTNKSALDLGCGTGTTAFPMAKVGFKTTGIDISETALEMGRELAKQQNLQVNFISGDVLNLSSLNEKFDLIYDSHLLHCIVFDEDRMKVLKGTKSILKPYGVFILDTMVMPPAQYDPAGGIDSLRFDQDYILWHKTRPTTDRGVVELDGQHWCAQRRIYPAETIMSEVARAGFTVLEKQIDEQKDEPSMLRLVLQ